MAASKTLRKSKHGSQALFVVESGLIKYKATLYVDGLLVDSKSGLLGESIEKSLFGGTCDSSVYLSGEGFAAHAVFGVNRIQSATLE